MKADDRPVRGAPEAPMRILFVTNAYPENGSRRGVYVEELLESLRQIGHVVELELIAQGRGRSDYLLAARRVARRANDGSFDVVHVHFGLTALASRLLHTVPSVLSLYGSDINDRWRRWATKLGWGAAAARIYVSERLRSVANDKAGHVIPNGVDFSVFRPGDRVAARAELGIPADRKLVLFGSDPARAVKRYDVFKDVLGELRKRGRDVDEVVLTDGNESRRDVVLKMDAADLLLFTSRQGSEGSPTVVKEATAMCLPVVSVDVGDVAHVLSSVSPSAVVAFPAGSAEASRRELVDRLATAADEVLATGQRSDGRQRNEWLSSTVIAERVAAVYRSVLPR